MNQRGVILLAVGMLILGLLIGGLSGGVAGYFMGQNARAPFVTRFQPNQPNPLPNPPSAQQTPQPQAPFGQRQFPPAQNVLGAVVVESVEKDSPAEKAGVQAGDYVTAVGSTKLDVTHSLADVIQTYKPGDKVDLSITRGNRTLVVTVELGKSSDDATKAYLGIHYSSAPTNRRFPNG